MPLKDDKERMCFVLMPFSKEFKNQWELAFIPAIKETGLKPWRGDEKSLGTNIIMSDVTRSISEAEIIIADLTGKNPNVMYELGLAHAAKKPVIMLTQDEQDIPFDIMHIRYLKYDVRDLTALKIQLIDRINHTMSMDQKQNPDFFPELKIFGKEEINELEYLRKKTILVEVNTFPPYTDIFFNDRLIGNAPIILSVNPEAPVNSISAAFPEYFEYHREITPKDLSDRKIDIVLEPRKKEELSKRVPRWLRFRRVFPNNPVLMQGISYYLISISEYDEAMTEINEMLQVCPGWCLSHNVAGFLMAAKEQKDDDKAALYFQRVVSLRPDLYLGYYNLACIKSRQRHFEQCISLLNQILESDKLLKSYCCSPTNIIEKDEDFDLIKNDKKYCQEFNTIISKFSDAFQELGKCCKKLDNKANSADTKSRAAD